MAAFLFSCIQYTVLELVLERTQKIRTSNTRTLAFPNFEHLELILKNAGRTRTSESELRTSRQYEKFLISRHFQKKNIFLVANSKTILSF